MAAWCGVLFSIEHGSIVIAVATTAGLTLEANVTTRWAANALPWAGSLGPWISTPMLILLSIVNLASLLRSDGSTALQPAGLLGRLVARFTHTANPLAIALVGALFALSFDTLSQALLFSAAAVNIRGWASALLLSVLFTLGMRRAVSDSRALHSFHRPHPTTLPNASQWTNH